MLCTDIVKIIKACGESGVSSFKYMDLSLEFGNDIRYTQDVSPVQSLPYSDISHATIDPNSTEGYNDTEDEEEYDGIPADQVMDELKFTDPEAWDELAQAGEV